MKVESLPSAQDNAPVFLSEDLQKTFEMNSRTLKGFLGELDRISNDIKAFEHQLRTCGITMPFHVDISDDGWFTRYDGEYLFRRCQRIAWSPDDKGTWRLMYETAEYAGYKDDDGYNHQKDFVGYVKNQKPLIETDMKTRVTSSKWLKGFLEFISLEIQKMINARDKEVGEDMDFVKDPEFSTPDDGPPEAVFDSSEEIPF